MACRDMEQTVNKLRDEWQKNKTLAAHYDLTHDELSKLMDISVFNTYRALTLAFDYGFTLGTRAKDKGHVQTL